MDDSNPLDRAVEPVPTPEDGGHSAPDLAPGEEIVSADDICGDLSARGPTTGAAAPDDEHGHEQADKRGHERPHAGEEEEVIVAGWGPEDYSEQTTTLLGPPSLVAGSDPGAFAAVENALARSAGTDLIARFETRVQSEKMALNRHLTALMAELLRQGTLRELQIALSAAGTAQVRIDVLLAGFAQDNPRAKRQIEDLLRKTGGILACEAKGFTASLASHQALTRLADAADKRVQDIDRHARRRGLDEMKLELMTQQAWDRAQFGPDRPRPRRR